MRIKAVHIIDEMHTVIRPSEMVPTNLTSDIGQIAIWESVSAMFEWQREAAVDGIGYCEKVFRCSYLMSKCSYVLRWTLVWL